MRQLHLLAVVAIAAIVLVGWLIFSDEPGQAAAAQGAASGEDAPASAVPVNPPRAADSSADVARNATGLAPLAPEAAAVGAQPGERGLELIAVVGAARRRVAEVEMWWWEEPDGVEPKGYESLKELLQRGQFEAALSERASRLPPDENGRFHAPSPTARGQAIAVAPGLFGRESVGPITASPCLIELESDIELAARVVDGSGAPVAGVTVALRQNWGGSFFHDHGRSTTDADGIARLRHFRQLIGGDWDYDGRYFIAIAEPLGQEVAKVIDITRPSTELVELVLPAVGVVEVELTGAGPDTWVELETPSPDTEFDEASERFRDGRRRPDGGKVRFEFVGLGRDAIVWTVEKRREKSHEEQRCRGPRFPGQLVSVKVRVEGARMRLAGRLVDESGTVFAGARFGVVLREPRPEDEGWAEHTEGRTDASGRFEVEFARGSVNNGSLEFDVRDAGHSVLAVGKRPLTAEGADLTIELGDVQVQGVPVRATGLVQDARGAPVPRALVLVYRARERQRGRGSVTRSWSRLWPANTWSDDHGRFTVRTAEKDAMLALRAQTTDARSAALEIRSGDRDIVLVLDEDGELSGRLALAATMPTDYLDVEVSRAAGEPVVIELQEYRASRVDSSGEFVARGLAPGLYDLRVHLQGREDPIASVASIRVSAGAGPRDPRLDPLDLRAAADLVEVSLFDPDGRVPTSAVVRGPVEGRPGHSRQNWTSSGRVLIDRRDSTQWVDSPNCLLERLEPAAVGPELHLRRAPQVRVVLEDGLPVPGDGVRMEVSLHGASEPVWLANAVEDAFTFDESRAAQGPVRRSGALVARVWLHGEGSASVPVEFVGGNTVAESPTVQTLTIRYSREAFEAALGEARQ